MKIETKETKKEITEETTTFYAFDGTEFSSVKKCAAYELRNHYFPNKAEWCKVNSVEEFAEVVRLWAIDWDQLVYGVMLDDERVDETIRNDQNIALFDKIGDCEIIKLAFPKLEDTMFPMIIKKDHLDDSDGYHLPIFHLISTTYAKKLAQEEIDEWIRELNNLSNIEYEFMRDEEK